MGKVADNRSEPSTRAGRDQSAENGALPGHRFQKPIAVAWLSLGLASVALAVIAALVLRSERESTATLKHLNLIALNLQAVLSDLADAEAEERTYVLTPRPSSLESFEQSRRALGLEFDRLTALVQSNPAERREIDRVRYLVQQALDELQRSIVHRRAGAESQAAFTSVLTDRARNLTDALRKTILGVDEENERALARLAAKRRVRLATALVADSAVLLLAGAYLLIGQILIARSASQRKKAEAALRASESRFETLCEQAPVGIYSTDAEGLCVYTNSRWNQMSGLRAAESLGHGWKQALHPDDRETVFAAWKMMAQKGASWEYRLLTPQREIRWIRALATPIYSTEGEITGYVGTTEDITERKHAQLALQEREALNRAILNSLPANIAVLDTEGRIQAINDEWLRFAEGSGDPPACFAGIGISYLEVCRHAAEAGSADAGKALAGIQAVLAGKLRSFAMEYLSHSATEKRWFHMLVTPLTAGAGGVVVAHLDITKRKRAECAVRNALHELQMITDNMAPGVTRCSSDLRYLWVSRSYAAWLGRPEPEEFVGRFIFDVVGQAYYETIRPHIERTLSGKSDQYEVQVDLPAGGKRWIHTVYVPTKGPDDKVDGWIAVITDVTDRHKAEERLRESEQRFRAIFYQAAVGIAQKSIDGQWLLLNDRLCEILGYSQEELRGKTFLDVTHPDDREAATNARQMILTGKTSSWSTEHRYIRKDGATVWARVFLSLMRDQHNQPQYILSVIEDLTEKIQAVQRLRESEKRFRNMADTAPVMIWVSGVDKGCTFFNKVWLEFTGRTMEQELGNRWVENVHPDDLDRCLAVYASAFEARQSFQMEYRLRRADGEYRWLLDRGIPRFTPDNTFHGYIGSCIDITERIRAEDERQKFVSLADCSLEFIAMYDGGTRLSYVNPAGMRLVGLDTLQAACQVEIRDYFFPEDQPFIINQFFPRVLRDGHGTVEIRFRHFRTGEAIWMLFNVFSISDAGGAGIGWATVSVDLTERKRAERALEESRRELRALAGHLINAQEEERKRISRELHDDLNQKLAALAFDTENLILAPPGSVEEMKEPLGLLQNRIVQLSDDVRRISHLLHPSILEDLGLTAALRDLCDEFSRREGIEVVFEQEAVPASLPVDIASCLYRVSQEALHNVLKHAHATQVRLTVTGSPQGVQLYIHDNGIGFNAQAVLPRPGLGIVSMKERVRLVQGEFSIHSAPGQGTDVRVFVPLLRAAAP